MQNQLAMGQDEEHEASLQEAMALAADMNGVPEGNELGRQRQDDDAEEAQRPSDLQEGVDAGQDGAGEAADGDAMYQ
jgi:hypothetical protein